MTEVLMHKQRRTDENSRLAKCQVPTGHLTENLIGTSEQTRAKKFRAIFFFTADRKCKFDDYLMQIKRNSCNKPPILSQVPSNNRVAMVTVQDYVN